MEHRGRREGLETGEGGYHDERLPEAAIHFSAFMEHDRLLMNETGGQRCFSVTGRLRVYGVFAEQSRDVWGPV